MTVLLIAILIVLPPIQPVPHLLADESMVQLPEGRPYSFIVDNCSDASYAAHASLDLVEISIRPTSRTMIKYSRAELVQVNERGGRCTLVTLKPGAGTGWVLTELVPETSAESLIRIAAERKADIEAERAEKAARVEAQRAEKAARAKAAAVKERREKDMAERAKRDYEIISTCTKLYSETIDKKTSDLTVRQSQQISACTTLGYYRKF